MTFIPRSNGRMLEGALGMVARAGRVAAWLKRNQARLSFSLRMVLAALFAYVIGEALGLAQTYWAVLSAVIVMQGSVGGALTAGVNRLVGTMGGAVWGAAAAVVPHATPLSMGLALAIGVAPLALVTAFRPTYRVAPITAVIVLMGSAAQKSSAIESALSRVAEIGLGSAVAVAVALLIWPARAHRLLDQACARVLTALAELMPLLAGALDADFDAKGLAAKQAQIRAALAQVEARAQEAKVERENRLANGPDPERLLRILRRLRHDLAMLTRIAGGPSGLGAGVEVRTSLKELFAASKAWLEAEAKAFAAADEPPSLDAVDEAIAAFKLRVPHRGLGASQDGGALDERLFVLAFLFDQLRANLKDLTELTPGAGTRAIGAPPEPGAP